MNNLKKGLFLALALAMTMTFVMIPTSAVNLVDAQKDAVVSALIEKLVDNYDEYYTIPNIEATVIDVAQQRNDTVYKISVSLTRILRAESAADLPYVQGILTEASKLKTEARTMALSDLANLVNELENEYIGKEQYENAIYQVVVPNSATTLSLISISENLKNATFSIDYGECGLVPLEALRPATQAELRAQGIANAQNYTDEVVAARQDEKNARNAMAVTNEVNAQDYDRILARNYIRTYCCNSGLYSRTHTCPNRHPSYGWLTHDCANYVSQAIFAGGLSTDTTWQPYTQSWANVGAPYTTTPGYENYQAPGLTTYMLEKEFFIQTTNKFSAFAGSIVYWYGQHVGMVDQNDTVTMTYCAHNPCEKSKPFSNGWVYGFVGFSGDTGKISFLVPIWDSYADDWTTIT